MRSRGGLNNSIGIAMTFAVIVASGICGFSHAQDNPTTPPQEQNTTSTIPTDTPFVLHVTSREVVVDVVATDPLGGPITDLQPGDLEVIDRAPTLIRSLKPSLTSVLLILRSAAAIPRPAST